MAHRAEYEMEAPSTQRDSSWEEYTPESQYLSIQTPLAAPPRYSQISHRSTDTRPRVTRAVHNLTYQSDNQNEFHDNIARDRDTGRSDEHSSVFSPEIIALVFYLDDAEAICERIEGELCSSSNKSSLKAMSNMVSDALNSITEAERSVVSLPAAMDQLRRSASIKSRCREVILRSSSFDSPTSYDDKPHQYLEKTKLKKFTGILSDWPSFWQLYDALIHSRGDIEPIIKFNYLRNYLSGEPEELIRSLRLTAENYIPAVQLLLNRYGDSGKLRKLYVKKLENLKTPKYELSSLKSFSSSIRCIFAELHGIYNPPDTVDYISTSLTSKLPRKIYTQLATDTKKFEFSVPELLDAVDLHINLLEYLDLSEDEDNKPKKHVDSSSTKTHTSRDSHTKTFTNSKQPPVGKPRHNVSCPLCNGTHKVVECKTYKGRDNIHDRVKRLNLCFNCLSSKHKSHQCTSKFSCYHCHQRHHSVLCNLKSSQLGERGNRSGSHGNEKSAGSSSHTNTTHRSPAPERSVPSTHTNTLQAEVQTADTPTNSTNVSSSTRTKTNSSTSSNFSDKEKFTLNINEVISMFNATDVQELPPAVLPTSQIKITRGRQQTQARALIDSGSQKSFISTELAKRLKLPVVNKIRMQLNAFLGNSLSKEFDVVKARVKLGHRHFVCRLIVHDNVCTPITCAGLKQMHRDLRKRGIKLADPDIRSEVLDDIQILIGVDYFSKVVTTTRRIGNYDTLVTPAGVAPFGQTHTKLANNELNGSVAHVHCSRLTVDTTPKLSHITPECNNINDKLDYSIEQLWSLDTIGIKPEQYTTREQVTVDKVVSSLSKTPDGYVVKLPFDSEIRPSVNYKTAYAQMANLVSKFQRDVEMYEQYQNVISDYLSRDFIEPISLNTQDGCFLPHHPVIKDSVTTPLRIVFNASSKPVGGKSLNDCMHSGPSLTQKLLDNLLIFRSKPYAVVADISKAFHRIYIHPEDRKFTKFLWIARDRAILTCYQFQRVIFGLNSSPYVLSQVLKSHLSLDWPIPHLDKNFYVDNFLKVYDEETTAVAEKVVIDNVLADASMPLQSWNSNSTQFRDTYNVELDQQSMLGLLWEASVDRIRFKSYQFEIDYLRFTKRKFVSCVASVFDPLGLVSPLIITCKLLIQTLWQNKVGWDDVIPHDIALECGKSLKEFHKLNELFFPRFVLKNPCSLVVYTDASQKAYGAVAYSYCSNESHLICSKARVAPCNKTLTIPKLELMAILVGCRLINNLFSQFDVTQVSLYSDSLVAISWVSNVHKDLKDIFVSNRVKEIQTLMESRGIKIFHTDSLDNPSDNCSKAKSAKHYINNELWEHGPRYMRHENWEIGRSIQEIREKKFPSSSEKQEIEKEVRKKSLKAHINLTQLKQTQLEQNIISSSTQDERHNENQTSAAMLLQVLDENNAENEFVHGERGSGKTTSEKIGFKS